ncbi:MAG: class I SAM-dependent DNA methyltransferase, partial [Bacteroidaceae bacterium]|nr:class I SAM-dependent DNA methyltransferase [Bacteroidaceae bacterium]
GMHYTSIENIHKVIDPLFLEELTAELDSAHTPKQLKALQDRLARLTFLDPACGSGNFLTETFISLRRIENEIITRLNRGQAVIGFDAGLSPIKVSISQFYGIEINDFAVTVARTALWIAEHQMLQETQRIVRHDLDYLPLKSYNTIREGDALKMDWCEIEYPDKAIDIYARYTNIITGKPHPYTFDEDKESQTVSEPAAEYGRINLHTDHIVFDQQRKKKSRTVRYDYIIGNPPFVGARMMSQTQKDSLTAVFGKKWKNVGNLDFVCAWYKKAAAVIRGKKTRAALVSTNSICQGETVANLWQPLMKDYGLGIDFAHRTFRWDSESEQMAHVHCIVVGFSANEDSATRRKTIFDGDRRTDCAHINAYLLPDGADVFVGSRSKALCDVPDIGIGNKPIDGGNYLFTEEEMQAFIAGEPEAKQYFRPWYGSQEFINRTPRYCLWLGDCTPAQLRSMPRCLERVKAVREFRLKSKSAGTVKLADRPTRFHVENMPDSDFLLIPRVSSENRRYIPIGFMSADNLVSDSVHIIPNATLYHFGILTSSVHMAWMRAVCGRLEMRYRYSKDIVYNNFPWPATTEEQKAKIEQTAQAILDARSMYPDSTLADLYDEVTMPIELRKAHQANDRAVMQAYGFPIKKFTEEDCVARLMELYKEMTETT